VFTYSAICDVPEETLVRMTAWLLEYRHRIGTRTGRRAGTVRAQAKLVLRWFRDDAPLRQLAAEAGHWDLDGLPVSARGHRRYRRAGPGPARRAGTRTAGRVVAREPGRDVDHHRPGRREERERPSPVVLGQAQDPRRQRADPRRPGRVSRLVQEPGSVHDIAAARNHCLPALYAAAAAGLPTLTDKGYQGAGIGVHSPVKGHNLHVGNASYNMLLTALRALGERANAELKQRWKCLRRIRLCPSRIGDIVTAGIALSTLQRGNY